MAKVLLHQNQLESQILNLWIAFETLFSSSNIAVVLKRVKTSIINRIGYLVFNALQTDVYFWREEREYYDLEKRIFNHCDSNNITHNLAQIICVPENKEFVCSELLAHMDKAPFLRHKIYQVHKQFNTSEAIQNTIEQYSRKIEWDVKRLYQARNLIVHTGSSVEHAEELVQIIHTYFDVVLNEVIRVRDETGLDSLAQVFDYSDRVRRIHHEELKKHNEVNNVNFAKLIFSEV